MAKPIQYCKVKKEKKRKISNNLALYLKQLEKEEQTKSKFSKEEINPKDQSRNKWKRDKENYGKDQWN